MLVGRKLIDLPKNDETSLARRCLLEWICRLVLFVWETNCTNEDQESWVQIVVLIDRRVALAGSGRVSQKLLRLEFL
jgi:hypothetical protein